MGVVSKELNILLSYTSIEGTALDDRKVHPVAYASRTVQGAERHYASTQLEALAVIWAVRLYGDLCTILTDNQALKSLLKPSSKLARWGMSLQELDVTIEHRAGQSNGNADTLPEPLGIITHSTKGGSRTSSRGASLSDHWTV